MERSLVRSKFAWAGLKSARGLDEANVRGVFVLVATFTKALLSYVEEAE